MSHETEITLREYIEKQIQGERDRFDTYVAGQEMLHERLAEQVAQAAASMEKRLEAMNELRTQINSERGNYVTRDMLDARIAAVDQRIEAATNLTNTHFRANADRISDLEQARANLEGRIAALAGVLVVVQVLVSLAAHFWK